MLNIFKKRRKKIIDNILGILTFRKSNRFDESYWTVNRKVNSANELVEFYIYNNEDGINESQKKLILEIEKKYPQLIGNFEKFLNTKIHEFEPNHLNISINKDLDVNFINIPENSTEFNTWELNLVEKRGFTNYEITIENWVPIDLVISA